MHTSFLRSAFATFCGLFLTSASFGQLTVAPSQTAAILAAKLAGPGITITSPVLTCPTVANGIFHSLSTPLTVDSGIILTSGKAIGAIGVESFNASTNNGAPGDASLTTLAGTATHDACVLEFDFIPSGDTVSFNYQFGSEEYNNSTCGQYNDDFAFFISGPGITGAQNMALVPLTNIPVTVNSINNGIPGPAGFPGFCNIANCTSMGPGSPFTGYYYDNTGGTQLTYKGFTTRLAAVHDVIPCNTYHLKIAIADASNNLYDSGVFIEAGSLKTNSFSFNRADSIGITINGLPHSVVRGCAPTTVTVLSGHTLTTAQTVHFAYSGTAIHGTDYTAPDSATIAAGGDSVVIPIGTLVNGNTGTQTIKIKLTSSSACSGSVDSITLNIVDMPTAAIATPDTTICMGTSFLLRGVGSVTGLVYSWSPATSLNDPNIMRPVASPIATTTYTMSVTLPGAGCPTLTGHVTVAVTSISVSITSPDTAICLGASMQVHVTGDPTYSYHWLPLTGLTNAGVQQPIAAPTATTTYTLTATSSAGCVATGAITITVTPSGAIILTPDTAICIGQSLIIRGSGDPALTYTWSPGASLDNPAAMQPVATPTVTTTYIMVASLPGSYCISKAEVTVSVLSVEASTNPDKNVCRNAEIILDAYPAGNYSYSWSGPGGYVSDRQHAIITNAIDVESGTYTALVTDNATGCSATASTQINVVGAAPLTNVTQDQNIAYGSSIQLNADNALYYSWSPNDGSLDNPNINNPIAVPLAPTTYVVHGRDPNGCLDSASVHIGITYDTVFIPSGFSPNGDGLNDLFRVGNLGQYRMAEMSVYNRWGTLVYHSANGQSNGWDGTFNGTQQDAGVFNYNIILIKPGGEQLNYKGTITLIR